MALVVKDRVKETTTTTGTGTLTLDGAATGFQAFSVIGDGNTTYYTITNGTDWEVGIGTYTSSGTTLSRDTILESSNSGNAVNWGVGAKDVFVTYPAEQAVYFNAAGQVDVDNLRLDGNTLSSTNTDGNIVLDPDGTGSVDVSSAKIVNVASPTTGGDAVNKTYVDSLVAAGVHFHEPVRVESPINLVATYNNGTSGVGATLTNAGTQVALVIDGVTLNVADRVLVYQQTDQTQNGVYVVSDVGSGATNWILTRSTDTDTYGVAGPTTLSEGSTFFVQEGATGAGETYTCNTVGTITFGTTNITFAQISSAQIYSAGAGLDLTGTQFSVETNGITDSMLRQSAGLSVIGRSANTTGDVADITAASDGEVLRRSGTSIGFGTVITDGIADNAVTDAKLRDSAALSVIGNATNATANPADIAATSDHEVLRRSGTSVGFGAVALDQAAAVTGALPFANGGTGQATQQAAMNALAGAITSGQYLRGNGTNVVMSSIQAGDVPTLNQNTTGNAATATALQTARTIGGVSFDGTANINLPGVNTAGNQNTSGTAAVGTAVTVTTSTTSSAFKVPFANTTASTTGNYGLLQDSTATFTYNPSTNTLVVGTVSGALSGNATTATTATNLSGGTVSATTITATTSVYPATDNTGAVGNSTFTWSSGHFTNMTIDSTISVRGAVDLADNDILRLGSSDDWEFFHNGTDNYMDLNVGNLIIRDNTTTRFTFTRTTGAFTATGNITANSDERLKKDWQGFGIDFVEKLTTVKNGTYTRTDTGNIQVGVSAQSLQNVIPEAVLKDDNGYLSVAYGHAALASVVELAKEIVNLREKIKALQKNS